LTEEELRNRDRVDDLFGIDSMTMLEFVTALEKEFGITIDPDHLNFDTLTDLARLADYITSTQAAEGSAGPDAASAPS
jgi:acyl carrier protein